MNLKVEFEVEFEFEFEVQFEFEVEFEFGYQICIDMVEFALKLIEFVENGYFVTKFFLRPFFDRAILQF